MNIGQEEVNSDSLVDGAKSALTEKNGVRGSKKRNLDHLIYKTDGTFVCENCQKTYQANLPAPLGIVMAILNWWKKAHQYCKRKA